MDYTFIKGRNSEIDKGFKRWLLKVCQLYKYDKKYVLKNVDDMIAVRQNPGVNNETLKRQIDIVYNKLISGVSPKHFKAIYLRQLKKMKKLIGKKVDLSKYKDYSVKDLYEVNTKLYNSLSPDQQRKFYTSFMVKPIIKKLRIKNTKKNELINNITSTLKNKYGFTDEVFKYAEKKIEKIRNKNKQKKYSLVGSLLNTNALESLIRYFCLDINPDDIKDTVNNKSSLINKYNVISQQARNLLEQYYNSPNKEAIRGEIQELVKKISPTFDILNNNVKPDKLQSVINRSAILFSNYKAKIGIKKDVYLVGYNPGSQNSIVRSYSNDINTLKTFGYDYTKQSEMDNIFNSKVVLVSSVPPPQQPPNQPQPPPNNQPNNPQPPNPPNNQPDIPPPNDNNGDGGDDDDGNNNDDGGDHKPSRFSLSGLFFKSNPKVAETTEDTDRLVDNVLSSPQYQKLLNELNSLKKVHSEAENTIFKLQDDIDNLSISKQELEKEIETLNQTIKDNLSKGKTENKQYENKIKALENKIKEINNTKNALLTKNQNLTSDLQKAVSINKSLQSSYDKFRNNAEDTTNQLTSDYENKIKLLNEKNTELTNKNTDLTTTYNSVLQEKENLTKQLSDLQNEKTNLENQLQQSQNSNTEQTTILNQQLQQNQNKINELTNTIEQLNKTIETLKSNQQVDKTVIQNYIDLLNYIHSHPEPNEELEKRKNQLQELQKKYKLSQQQIDNLSWFSNYTNKEADKKIAELNRSNQQLKDSYEKRLSDKDKDYENKIKQLNTSISEKEKAHQNKINELTTSMNKKEQDYQNKINELNEKIKEAGIQNNETLKQKLQSQKEQLTEQQKELENELNNKLNEQQEKYNNDVSALQKKIKELEKEISNTNVVKDTYKNAFEGLKTENDGLKTDLNKQLTVIGNKNNQLTNLNKQLTDLNTKLSDKDKQLIDLNTKLSDKDKQLINLDNERQNQLTELNNQLSEKDKQLTLLNSEKENLSKSLVETQTLSTELKEAIKNLINNLITSLNNNNVDDNFINNLGITQNLMSALPQNERIGLQGLYTGLTEARNRFVQNQQVMLDRFKTDLDKLNAKILENQNIFTQKNDRIKTLEDQNKLLIKDKEQLEEDTKKKEEERKQLAETNKKLMVRKKEEDEEDKKKIKPSDFNDVSEEPQLRFNLDNQIEEDDEHLQPIVDASVNSVITHSDVEPKVYFENGNPDRPYIDGHPILNKNGTLNKPTHNNPRYRSIIDRYLHETGRAGLLRGEIDTYNIEQENVRDEPMNEPQQPPQQQQPQEQPQEPQENILEKFKSKVGANAKVGKTPIFRQDGAISGSFLGLTNAVQKVNQELGTHYTSREELEKAFNYKKLQRPVNMHLTDQRTVEDGQAFINRNTVQPPQPQTPKKTRKSSEKLAQEEAERFLNRGQNIEGFNISVLDKLHKKYANYVKPKEFDAIIYSKMKKRYPDLSQKELDKKFVEIIKDYDRVNRPTKYQKRMSKGKYDNYNGGWLSALLPMVPTIISGIKSLFSKGNNPDSLEPSMYKGSNKYKKQFRGCAVMSLSDLNSMKQSIK